MSHILKIFPFFVIMFNFSSLSFPSELMTNKPTFGPFSRSPFFNVSESDVQKIDIGDLPEIFSKTPRLVEHGIEIVELPVGTMLHKAMTIPLSGLLSQTDIFNIYAAGNSWLTNLHGAREYSFWGFGNVSTFEIIQKVKLFDISSASNWKIVWSKMNIQLKFLYQTKLHLNISSNVQLYIQKKIDHLLFQQKIIQLTVGYGVNWKKQQELLLEFGDAITNDFNYHPRDQLRKRKCNPHDWFSINDKPTVLVSGKNTFGWRNEDLNRVSFTTALDNLMADIITEFLNVDGYYSGKVPSLFHRDGVFAEEIAIHIPRDKLTIVNTLCEKDFYPCRSKCYNPEEQECLLGKLVQWY